MERALFFSPASFSLPCLAFWNTDINVPNFPILTEAISEAPKFNLKATSCLSVVCPQEGSANNQGFF